MRRRPPKSNRPYTPFPYTTLFRSLKVGVARAELLTDRLTRHPDWPLDTKVLAAAVRDVIEDQCGPRRYRAVDDLLSGAAPRLNGIDGDILCGGEPVAGAIAAAHAMDQTLLPIQGPPGTGKTHVTEIGRAHV